MEEFHHLEFGRLELISRNYILHMSLTDDWKLWYSALPLRRKEVLYPLPRAYPTDGRTYGHWTNPHIVEIQRWIRSSLIHTQSPLLIERTFSFSKYIGLKAYPHHSSEQPRCFRFLATTRFRFILLKLFIFGHTILKPHKALRVYRTWSFNFQRWKR